VLSQCFGFSILKLNILNVVFYFVHRKPIYCGLRSTHRFIGEASQHTP
jgi:hypothetical protein